MEKETLIKLKSVGTYIDTETLYIYPELAQGGYDKELYSSILYDDEINPEFWERLSKQDYLKVVKVLINIINN